MWGFGRVCCLALISITLSSSLVESQEAEFASIIKNFLQGDELKTFQQTYAALPLEIRNKLTKDLLSNPGQVGQDLLNFLGPKVQNLLQNIKRPADAQNEVGVESMNLDYKDGRGKKPAAAPGFDFSAISGVVGNMLSSNPQMLLELASGLMQGNNGQGFSFDTIANLATNHLDIDTVLSLAQTFGVVGGGGNAGTNDRRRGEGDAPKQKGIADMLQISEIVKQWTTFAKSPMGQKVNRVLPRLLKSETLPDALRILEKETSFRFDIILRQLQDPHFRGLLVAQTVKPIGQFFETITIPKDLKEVLSKADDLLNNKLGLGVKAKEFIEPVFNYIRDTFSITRESLMDFKAKDVEKIATDVLNNEILQPLSLVWDAHEKARKNSQCASFIYCQLNYNFYNENFIRRNVIKTSSIISAFQVSAAMKRDAFSQLYEGAYKGAEGYDCTHGVNTRCLDLMNTAPHNEL